MKRKIVGITALIMMITASGCMGQQQPQLTEIKTEGAPAFDSVKLSDYTNDLEGLEKYFKKLAYLPDDKPTEMMYEVIGAVDGDRFSFKLNSSPVVVELYEYDPDNLGKEGNRVISEVKENGEFHVFDNKDETNIAYKATLSDSGKFLMIYTDNSDNNDNKTRTNDVIKALKAFKGGKSADSKNSESKAEDKSASESDNKTESKS